MDYQEVINKLQTDSTYFKQLKPQFQLYVAEYCSNGFSADQAAKTAGAKSSNKFNNNELVDKAVEEFMAHVLADKVGKMQSMIVDVLWQRAFYCPLDFVDEDGQPRFNVENYKEELGIKAVVIDGIKPYVHAKNQDYHWVEVQLADRQKALKELANYIGFSHEEKNGTDTSKFTVNVNVNGEKQEAPDYEIAEYVKHPTFI